MLKAINTVNSELFFGIYAFTDVTIGNLIKTKYQAGITVRGMMDSYSTSPPNTPYTTLNPVMGSNLKIYTGASSYNVYHNKTMLVDPLTPSSDPQVYTGSYNWTSAGTNTNDENAIIIHDSDVANQYYQSFCQNFADLGGTACTNIATGIAEEDLSDKGFTIYPNPFDDRLALHLYQDAKNIRIRIYDGLGSIVLDQKASNTGEMQMILPALSKGMYFAVIEADGTTFCQKLLR